MDWPKESTSSAAFIQFLASELLLQIIYLSALCSIQCVNSAENTLKHIVNILYSVKDKNLIFDF